MPESALVTFKKSLKNPYTKRNYETNFDRFAKWAKLSKSCNELLTMDARKIEDKIVKYVEKLESAGKSTSTLIITMSAIRKFFVANRAESRLNWKWLNGNVTKNNGVVKDRDYTKQELQTVLKHCDSRKRAILLLLMTGIRRGAIPGFKVRNLKKITEYHDSKGERQPLDNHIYKLTVYEGEKEEYYTFLTNEAAKAIDTYLDTRRKAGEEITPESPLIRNSFDSLNGSEPVPITESGLNMLFIRLARSAGIRNVKDSHTKRHDVMLFHGIRKYVNHAYVNAKCGPIHTELLLGHRVGLQHNYLRPTEDEMLMEWLKAVPTLSLTDEAELRSENEKLKIEVSDVGAMRRSYRDMKDEFEKKEKEWDMLLEMAKNENGELETNLEHVTKFAQGLSVRLDKLMAKLEEKDKPPIPSP